MAGDKFPDLTSLKMQLKPEDYKFRVLDRGSWATIIAPHGGYIEAGTSAIAAAVAGRNYNLFDFRGLRPELASQMHITSTRFRDPALSKLLKQSQVALSFHGMGTRGDTTIWLGGLNAELKAQVLTSLQAEGFAVNPDSPLYRGENPRNVVNRARLKGVQLELSEEFLELLFRKHRFTRANRSPARTQLFGKLVHACRAALHSYQQQQRSLCRRSRRN